MIGVSLTMSDIGVYLEYRQIDGKAVPFWVVRHPSVLPTYFPNTDDERAYEFLKHLDSHFIIENNLYNPERSLNEENQG